MVSVGIIGSAGRKEDGNKITNILYKQLKVETKHVITKILTREDSRECRLISGGAAFADSVTVSLFLEGFVENLTLHLPCKFDTTINEFIESPDKKFDTGKTANYYHRRFSEKCGKSKDTSLKMITRAINNGAKHTTSYGFFQRNLLVAQDSQYLIAATFGNKDILKDGGTTHTMKQFLMKNAANQSFHIDLNTMKTYCPAKVT
ncbi:MAG: hypothetical protein Q8P06_00425 [Candidatus Azambacteria bacterium]|nr:hypothetical protein [Candidatus Azambacteria bacterium]